MQKIRDFLPVLFYYIIFCRNLQEVFCCTMLQNEIYIVLFRIKMLCDKIYEKISKTP